MTAKTAAAARSQAPPRGVGQRILGRFHVTGVFWYRFHARAIRVLPEWAKRMLVPCFMVLFILTLRRIRLAIGANLVPVLGPCGWWRRQARVWETMRQFGWCQTERYENLAGMGPFRFRAEGVETWREWAARGGILLTAHIGNWEFGSMLPATADGRTIHVVREEEMDPRAQEFVRELLRANPGGDLWITHFAASEPTLGLELLDALRRGDMVALQGDRPREGGRSQTAQVFGRPLSLPSGPAVLARASGASILPVFVFREGRFAYRIVFRSPVVVEEGSDRDADVRAAVLRIAADIEWAITQEPHQWFCFASLWPDSDLSGSRP